MVNDSNWTNDAQKAKGISEILSANSRSRLFLAGRVFLLIVLLVAMGAWVAQWIKTAFLFVHETDARIMTDLVSISSEVNGRLLKISVEEGDQIVAGQLLAEIDPKAAILKVKEMKAERSSVKAEFARVEAETEMISQQTETRIRNKRSNLAEAEIVHSIYVHELSFAQAEFNRIQELSRSGVVSESKLDRTRRDFLKAEQELLRAKTAISTAKASLDEALADRTKLMVKVAERSELEARLLEIDTRLESQLNDVEARKIVSPMEGLVSRMFVKSGEYLSVGQRLMVVHNPDRIRVETNIRETEIGRVKVGQPVRIQVDAYPGMVFSGRIGRIGTAATSQFALLPSLNETGTFTKITQRIKVLIDIEQQRKLLKPGMMVEIFIDDGTVSGFMSWLR